jgi:hypothetical protein
MGDFDFSRVATGGAMRPDSFTGMDPAFAAALAKMFQSAPPEIASQLQVSSGFRSPERQATLFADAVKKYGSEDAARKWVAPPGKSQHNHGHAADLKFLGDSARKWAHANATQYGLSFPLSNEDWHVEMAGARGGSPGPVGPQGAMGAAGVGPRRDGPVRSADPQNFGDVVAPPAPVAPPDLGSVVATYLQQREKRNEAEAADKARKQALFGDGLGGLYG